MRGSGTAQSSTLVIPELDLDDVRNLLTNDMVIEGGHYIVGELLDPVSVWTWDKAVELYALSLRLGLRNIGLMLLIDDFAVESGLRDDFRSSYVLPAALLDSIRKHNVNESSVTIVWEVQLRNHARADLRKRLKPRIAVEEDGYYVQCDDGVYRPLTTGTTPICNLIVARYVLQKDRSYKSALSLYDLRWECQSKGGVAVSRVLYDTAITVFNIYVTLANRIAFAHVHWRDGSSPAPIPAGSPGMTAT